jgi:VWFA-related protein
MRLLLGLILSVFLAVSIIEAQQNRESFSPERFSLTVTASGENGFVRNLTAEDFEVYLENKRGALVSVKQTDEPVSIGFLVDVSSSMRDVRREKSSKTILGIKGFPSFLANANPENDYFVMSFAGDINLALDSTRDGEKVKKTLGTLEEKELRQPETKFYEAVKTGYEKIRAAKHRKKVLILVSDGYDSGKTKLKFDDIEKIVRQNDVLLYIVRAFQSETFEDLPEKDLSLRQIPIFGRDFNRIQFEFQPFASMTINYFLISLRDLDELSASTGGRVFFPLTQADSDETFRILADELKSQYSFQVKPPADLKKTGANAVKIKIPKLKNAKKVSVRARKEFYF